MLAFVFLIVPGLLWFYSASYKRQLIIGNAVIAFLSALSVLIVLFTELEYLKTQASVVLNPAVYNSLFAWVSGFALFSFLLTWIREIIKDMEDVYGDREDGVPHPSYSMGIFKSIVVFCNTVLPENEQRILILLVFPGTPDRTIKV